MREYLTERLKPTRNAVEAKNVVREYLQARILGCLQRCGAMVPLAFHGGTALRFLFSLPRYSEDLDFALERDEGRYDLRTYLLRIRHELGAEGYEVGLKVNDSKVVHSAFVRFPGLLYALGLSGHQEEALAVKIEVDTNPPPGARVATTVIRRHVLLHLQHHDPATLLAGKVHAVLCRPYPKGRDLYDLLWYLSDSSWPSPNFTLLNHALDQTHWEGAPLGEQNWQEAVSRRIDQVPFDQVVADVAPFIEPGGGLEFLTRENLRRLLSKASAGST